MKRKSLLFILLSIPLICYACAQQVNTGQSPVVPPTNSQKPSDFSSSPSLVNTPIPTENPGSSLEPTIEEVTGKSIRGLAVDSKDNLLLNWEYEQKEDAGQNLKPFVLYFNKFNNMGTEINKIPQQISGQYTEHLYISADIKVNKNDDYLQSWSDSDKTYIQKYSGSGSSDKQLVTIKGQYSSSALNQNGDFVVLSQINKMNVPVPMATSIPGEEDPPKYYPNKVITVNFYNTDSTLKKEIEYSSAFKAYVTTDNEDNFLLTYAELRPNNTILINLQKFDNNGNALGAVKKIDTGIQSEYNYYSFQSIFVKTLSDGKFAVSWEFESVPIPDYFKIIHDPKPPEVYMQVFDKNNFVVCKAKHFVSRYNFTPNYSIVGLKNGKFGVIVSTSSTDLQMDVYNADGTDTGNPLIIQSKAENTGLAEANTIILKAFNDDNDNITVAWVDEYFTGNDNVGNYLNKHKVNVKKYNSDLLQTLSYKAEIEN